jgi:hypothetical protein
MEYWGPSRSLIQDGGEQGGHDAGRWAVPVEGADVRWQNRRAPTTGATFVYDPACANDVMTLAR